MLFFNIPLESFFLFLKKNFIFFLSLIFLNPTNWFSVIDSEISLIFFPFREETFLFELIEKIYLFCLKFSILVKIRILMIFFVFFFLISHFCSFIKKKLLLLLFISFNLELDLSLSLFLSIFVIIKHSDNNEDENYKSKTQHKVGVGKKVYLREFELEVDCVNDEQR